jgi:predicted O-methyltransferase YrrM
MARENLSLSEQYIQKTFVKEDTELKAIVAELKSSNAFGINVGAHEGQLLQFIVGLMNPKLIIEVGMLYGYSALWLSRALATGGKIISIEKSIENFKKASALLKNVKTADSIELRNADAREELLKISEEIARDTLPKPDVVFIDADKANYRHYLDWAMQEVRVGGIIIGDNTFLFGHMIGEDRGEKTNPAAIESMTYFNETLAASSNFRSIMIPTYEGITLAQKLS